MSMNSIENLPNETFYEIFEYFDGCEIFHSFSKLNYHFQKLINSSSLLLKLKLAHSKLEKTFMNNYQQILFNNKNQISSIHLSIPASINQIVASLTFDSSFTCLESLNLYAIKEDVLVSFLPKLTCLPRLFSLVIQTRSSTQHDIGVVYHSIFNLSKLKYLKYFDMECNESDVTLSLPVATNGQISSIEYLIIDHPCTFKELSAIISYTPHLRLLKFLNVTSNNKDIRAFKPIVLPNLTHLYIYIYDKMSFNAFEFFINKLNAKIKVLSLTTINEDVAYLDANRWEKFILTKLQ